MLAPTYGKEKPSLEGVPVKCADTKVLAAEKKSCHTPAQNTPTASHSKKQHNKQANRGINENAFVWSA